MAKYSEQQINNIYLRCNAAPMEQLLQLCLDPESGITIDGLRAVHYNKIEQLENDEPIFKTFIFSLPILATYSFYSNS